MEIAENPKGNIGHLSLDAQLVMGRNMIPILQQLGARCGLDVDAINVIAQLIEQRSRKDWISVLRPLLLKQFVTGVEPVTPVYIELVDAYMKLLFMVATRPTPAEVIDFVNRSKLYQQLLASAKFDGSRVEYHNVLNGATLFEAVGTVLAGNQSEESILLDALDESDDDLYKPFLVNLQHLRRCRISKLDPMDFLAQAVLPYRPNYASNTT